MKKFIFSLIGLFGISLSAFGQWSYISTNVDTGPFGAWSNNNCRLISPSNAVWEIDEITVRRTPGYTSSVTNLAFAVYDNNWSSNTSSTAYSKVTVSQYLTNVVWVSLPANTPSMDPGAAGAVWTNVNNQMTNAQGGTTLFGGYMFRNNLTNWMTNQFMYTLQATTSVTKATALTPKMVIVYPPGVYGTPETYTYSGLGMTLGKGVTLQGLSYASNTVAVTVKYRELFSPSRP